MSSLLELRNERLKKTILLRELGIDPYPSKCSRTHAVAGIVNDFEQYDNKAVILAGRLMSWREHGSIIFAELQDATGVIQIYIRDSVLLPTNSKKNGIGFSELWLLDIGDIVEIEGTITRTQKGTISIAPTIMRLLVKALRPLPDKWDGLKDHELLSRQRYLDLIINPEHKWRFQKSAEILFAIRQFLHERDFLEIKTPILQSNYGGTSAKPFKTHLNALNSDYYLAVSHELYLKRLITAGFENVFNIVGYFRNEGIDRSHNPEFNMIETMTAYKNYEYNMDLTEELYRYIGQKVFSKTTFSVAGQQIDFSKPWRRARMIDLVREYTGEDFDKKGANMEEMVKIFEEKVEDKLIEPTFVTNHPVEISPLAKRLSSDNRFVERFEIFIGGIEGGDNWTELNDPVELFSRFSDQLKRKKEGNEETHPMDLEFIEMMEYGMPPTTGLGPGVERLTMIFTEASHIDEVIFFPLLRPAPTSDLQKQIYGLN